MKLFADNDPQLDEAIASIFEEMKVLTADSPEYQKMVEQQLKLHSLKPKTVDPNVLLTVFGNLAIGAAVLNFEKTGVVTSKIWSFISKT